MAFWPLIVLSAPVVDSLLPAGSPPSNLTNPSFEDLLAAGFGWLNAQYQFIEIFYVMVTPTNGESDKPSAFSSMSIEAWDYSAHQLISVRNINGSPILWSIPHVKPFPERTRLSPWDFNSLPTTLNQAFTIMQTRGYTNSWAGVVLIQFKDSPWDPPNEQFFTFVEALERGAKKYYVGAKTGRILNADASDTLMLELPDDSTPPAITSSIPTS